MHDFGFLQYDPGAVQFMEYEEIPLSPESAVVGLDLRVVGNDSGEKVGLCQTSSSLPESIVSFMCFSLTPHRIGAVALENMDKTC